MNTYVRLISRFDEWVTERDRIERDEPHSRRAWEASDDDGIELLREMAAAIRAHNEQPCDKGPLCLHCGGRLTWFDDSGTYKVTTPLGRTDLCPPSPDRYHHPSDSEPRTLGALAAGQPLRIDPGLAPQQTEAMSNQLPPCPDCAATAGEPHTDHCEMARCIGTGRQRLHCEMLGTSQNHDCGHQTWSGEWPGNVECREFGWYVYGDASVERYWVRCGPDHPQATEDLNRLAVDAKWNPDMQRWQQKWPDPTDVV